MASPCREDAAQPEAPDVERTAREPVPLRVKLHPDIYALLARWMLEDMRKREVAT